MAHLPIGGGLVISCDDEKLVWLDLDLGPFHFEKSVSAG